MSEQHPSGSLKLSQHALTFLVDRVMAAHRPEHGMDGILILADAIDELAAEQKASGLTIATKSTAAEAARLRNLSPQPQPPTHSRTPPEHLRPHPSKPFKLGG